MTTINEKLAYWLNGTAYCEDCVECDSPCISAEEIQRSARKTGIGRCGCCGRNFDDIEG